jgi:hypothetical protein
MAHRIPFLGTIAVGAFHGYQTTQRKPVDYTAGAATLGGLAVWTATKLSNIPPISIYPPTSILLSSMVATLFAASLGHFAGRYVGYRKDDGV